jgi:hypothetical protein
MPSMGTVILFRVGLVSKSDYDFQDCMRCSVG